MFLLDVWMQPGQGIIFTIIDIHSKCVEFNGLFKNINFGYVICSSFFKTTTFTPVGYEIVKMPKIKLVGKGLNTYKSNAKI